MAKKKINSKPPSIVSIQCCSTSDGGDEIQNKSKRLSEQSSWESKDSDGKDYLYRLGNEADNVNVTVEAKSGTVDPIFAGNFLGARLGGDGRVVVVAAEEVVTGGGGLVLKKYAHRVFDEMPK